MAITNTGNSTASQSTPDTNVTITHGLTINSGDLVLAVIHANDDPTITENNGATPFTTSFEEEHPNATSRYSIKVRRAGASEPATYAWTLSTSQQWSVQIRVFSGVHADIWDVSPSAETRMTSASGTTATAPTMTIITAGAMGIVIVGTDISPAFTYSDPTNGYDSEVEPAAAHAQASYIRLWNFTGATGTTDVTLSATDDWWIFQIALKPTGGLSIATVLDYYRRRRI